MARIPDSPAPSVTPQAGRLPRVEPVFSPGQASISARQTQQAGQALIGASQQAGIIALDIKRRANELKVMEAENRLRSVFLDLIYDKQTGLVNQTGENAIYNPDQSPRSLANEYIAKFDEEFSKIGATLNNNLQLEAFQAKAQSLRQSFAETATRHELAEFRKYHVSVSEGAIALAVRELMLNYHDIEAVNRARGDIYAAVHAIGEIAGWSANEVTVRAMAFLSPAHKAVVTAAIERGELEFAEKYREQFAKEISGEDTIELSLLFDRQVNVQLAFKAVDDVMGMAVAANTPTAVRMDVIADLETGYLKNDPAARLVVRSPKDARGIYQIMPGTLKEAAKLAGVEWDEKRFETDAEYQQQLATAYYEANVKRFGNPVIAAVAYNAGPNLVQDWIDGTNKTGKNPNKVRLGPFYGDIEGWVSRIPFSETRKYAEDFMARVSERQGAGTPPVTLEDALLRLRNHPLLANNPKRLEIAENRLRFLYAARKESEQERRAKNMETVMDIVISSKGDMSQVPVSLMNALSPADRLTIMDLSNKLIKLGDVTKPEDFLALQELLIDPEKLRQTPAREIAMWGARLSSKDFEDLKMQWRVVNGAGPPDPKLGTVLDYAEINTVFNNKFDQEMPKYNKNNPEHVQRRAILLSQVQERIRQHQMRLRRQLNSDEIAKTVDVLFMTPSRYWRKYLWSSEQPENLQEERVVDMWVRNIPPELREQIKEYLKANGVLPTDAAIYREFVRRKYSAFERELARPAEKNQR